MGALSPAKVLYRASSRITLPRRICRGIVLSDRKAGGGLPSGATATAPTNGIPREDFAIVADSQETRANMARYEPKEGRRHHLVRPQPSKVFESGLVRLSADQPPDGLVRHRPQTSLPSPGLPSLKDIHRRTRPTHRPHPGQGVFSGPFYKDDHTEPGSLAAGQDPAHSCRWPLSPCLH